MDSVQCEISMILFHEQYNNNVVLSEDIVKRINTFYINALLDITADDDEITIYDKKQNAYFDVLFIIENQIKILVNEKQTVL